MRKYFVVIIFIVVVSAIWFLSSRTDINSLGENYYYLPDYEALDVGYPEGGIIYKSSEKYVFNNIIVHGNVIKISYDENFIIAIQLKDDSVKVEKVNKAIQYFIIEKRKGLLYGPYNKEKYLQKRYELELPNKLQFND